MTSSPYRARAPRVLDRRQRLVAPWGARRGTSVTAVSESGACARPVQASWLHPIEIYFSIVQRKVLTLNRQIIFVKKDDCHRREVVPVYEVLAVRQSLDAFNAIVLRKALFDKCQITAYVPGHVADS